ncbi:MAG: hypothetical protein R3C44_09245 [Chloroflexota bacterium]
MTGHRSFPYRKGQPDPAILEPELASIAETYDRIYVLFWGDAQRDPQHVVERWLDTHTFKAGEEWVGDVRFVTYAVPSGESGQSVPAGYAFEATNDTRLTLDSYAYQPQAAQPGDIVELQLQWSADTVVEQPYKVFVHLIDNAGNVVAQRDSEPVGGSRPTTTWEAGETIIDNYGLLIPLGTSPGQYRLIVGLYNPFEPSIRLPVTINGQVLDAAPLGTITVH